MIFSDRPPLPARWPWLASVARALLDLLFPPRCPGCGRVGAWLCPDCQARFVPPPCRVLPQPSPSVNGLVTAARYAHPLRDAIHQFKYRNNSNLAWALGRHLANAWRLSGLTADAIVPVPLHPRRLAERGYNQSLLLARVLADELGLPLEDQALVRQRATLPQVDLGAEQRFANVSGAFAGRGHFAGQRLALADDICTTGATLEECAAALRAIGALEVWAVTLARARWPQGDPVE